MHRIDAYLLDHLYQPICDALYDRIGDCFVIARNVITLAIGFSGLFFGWRLGRILLHETDSIWIIFVLPELLLVIGLIALLIEFRRFLGRTGANPFRFIFLRVRLMLLCWFVMLWVLRFSIDWVDPVGNILGIVRDLLVISAIYFASCHNLPPMKPFRRYAPV